MSIEHKQMSYQMLLTHENQIVIDQSIRSFGKWNQSSSEYVTKGVVYPILGDGHFDRTVKFLNNTATVDEASVTFFDLATKKEYGNQFKKLEQQPEKKEVPKMGKAKSMKKTKR